MCQTEYSNLPIKIDKAAFDWADKVYGQMDLKSKIGQLIHIPAWSSPEKTNINEVEDHIKKYKIGGIIFFQGTVQRHAELINQYQQLSAVPLMISIDAEWGLGMRLEGVESFPYAMTLGATRDKELTREMGNLIGQECRKLGIHVNFAPVTDINTNFNNPVISFRAFGDTKDEVTAHAKAYMEGLQENNVLACAKHFPGHGDTATDSHLELPVLDKALDELKEVELYPYTHLIPQGLGAIMTAHLSLPQMEKESSQASSLSSTVVKDLLIDEMGFGGLIFTDALDMQAVSRKGSVQPVLDAFIAGNDVLTFVKDVGKVVDTFLKAIEEGVIEEEEINRRCYKQLLYKAWLGLDNYHSTNLDEINDFNSGIGDFNRRAFQQAITLVKGEIKPDYFNQKTKRAYLDLFAAGNTGKYKGMEHHSLTKSNRSGDLTFSNMLTQLSGEELPTYFLDSEEIYQNGDAYLSELMKFDEVLVGIQNVGLRSPNNYGLNEELITFFEKLVNTTKVDLIFFGGPYALAKLRDLHKVESILLTYQENIHCYESIRSILAGELVPVGELSVSVEKILVPQ